MRILRTIRTTITPIKTPAEADETTVDDTLTIDATTVTTMTTAVTTVPVDRDERSGTGSGKDVDTKQKRNRNRCESASVGLSLSCIRGFCDDSGYVDKLDYRACAGAPAVYLRA